MLEKLGKPKIKLTSLEKTAINPQTQEEYETLLQIYDCGNWKIFWRRDMFEESNFCITAGEDISPLPGVGYADRQFYFREKWKIISPAEFYVRQGISEEMIRNAKKYFYTEERKEKIEECVEEPEFIRDNFFKLL